MNKTPVSVLQEMMVKKCLNPNYELIHDGGGTHLNTFTFQVTCDGLTATGTGRCKKDAKHEAAKAMLETIANVKSYPQLPASPARSPIRTPLPAKMPVSPKIPANVPFINAIGALQEVCAENNLQEPLYEAVSDVGPPHARVFTVQCTVSTFKEEGVATTKKQAKHEAAKKMLDRIMDVVSDSKNMDKSCNPYLNYEEIKRHEIMTNEMAKARYPELSRLPVVKKTNFGVKISEYHTRLKNTYDENVRCEIIKKLDTMINRIEMDIKTSIYLSPEYQLKKDFEDVLVTLSIEYKKLILASEPGSTEEAMVALKLDTSPEIVEIGVGKTNEEAEVMAISNVLQTLKLLLI